MKHGSRHRLGWLLAAGMALPWATALADVGPPPVDTQPAPVGEIDAGEAQPGEVDAAEMPSGEAEAAAERAAARVADDGGEPDAYTLHGMVGQVNGRPIYARTVFEGIHDALTSVARQTSRDAFRREAARIIAGQLEQIVTDALVLGAAERDLSENERLGMRHMVGQRREELLRRYGRGSVALAEATLQRQTGQGLDATLEDFRQEVLIQRYLHTRLFPRINVTFGDIRRYYHDHSDEFNPPAQRTLDYIRVPEADEAERIAGELQAGTAFAEVSDDVRQVDAPGQTPLAHDALNEALADLGEGEHAGPIEVDGEYWFIRVARLERVEGRSLQEAQIEIEHHLRNQQFRVLSEQYRRDLFAEGSYNPLDEMTEALLEIAMSRYAPPE